MRIERASINRPGPWRSLFVARAVALLLDEKGFTRSSGATTFDVRTSTLTRRRESGPSRRVTRGSRAGAADCGDGSLRRLSALSNDPSSTPPDSEVPRLLSDFCPAFVGYRIDHPVYISEAERPHAQPRARSIETVALRRVASRRVARRVRPLIGRDVSITSSHCTIPPADYGTWTISLELRLSSRTRARARG